MWEEDFNKASRVKMTEVRKYFQDAAAETAPRVGAVRFMNAKPLTRALPRFLPNAKIEEDIPSRLADRLRTGDLDVALIPTIEAFRLPDARFVGDACVACEGKIWSVRLFSRKPLRQIEILALDGASRTSINLARIVLAERYGVRPQLCSASPEPLPGDIQADAVVVIGDRAMQSEWDRAFPEVLDLGQAWFDWKHLPFVFAAWTTTQDIEMETLATSFNAARDAGVREIPTIIREASHQSGLPEDDIRQYFTTMLRFKLDDNARHGLAEFRRLAEKHGILEANS